VALMNSMGKALSVGLKYCGGCNPEYDRVALVKHMEESLQGKIAFVSPESKDVSLMVVVEGCSTACADLSAFQGMEVRIITSIKAGEKFIEEIRAQVE
jgi:hypothetical protein